MEYLQAMREKAYSLCPEMENVVDSLTTLLQAMYCTLLCMLCLVRDVAVLVFFIGMDIWEWGYAEYKARTDTNVEVPSAEEVWYNWAECDAVLEMPATKSSCSTCIDLEVPYSENCYRCDFNPVVEEEEEPEVEVLTLDERRDRLYKPSTSIASLPFTINHLQQAMSPPKDELMQKGGEAVLAERRILN